jgi:hypothetical protein
MLVATGIRFGQPRGCRGSGWLRFTITHKNHKGAYRFRPDGKRFRLRVVVGRLATLKVDQASIAEAQFSLAA